MAKTKAKSNKKAKGDDIKCKVSIVHCVGSKGKKVTGILSVTVVPLYKIKGKYRCTTCLEPGSQISFIRRTLLKYLKNEKIEGDGLMLKVFHHQEKVTHYDAVRVLYRYEGKTYSLDCSVEDNKPEDAEYVGLDKHLK